MRQKRIQGSHFAHLKQAASANQFVIDRRVDPLQHVVEGPQARPRRVHQHRHVAGRVLVLPHLGVGLRPVPAC
jgi:crotonyl-CoA carboxylase/reductase